MENVEKFRMVNSSVGLPLKLTGRHMGNVIIKDSSFTTLPWPGVFLHNSSHVEIVRNYFLQTMPRSISISLGNDIIISHNLLDVGEALKVEQYEHQIIKCNKHAPDVILPATCNVPILEYETIPEEMEVVLKHNDGDTSEDNPAIVQETSLNDDIRATIIRELDTIWTVLGTVDSLGFIWILVAIVAVLLFILCYCCCCTNRTFVKRKLSRRGDNKKTAAELRPDLLAIPLSGDTDECDEYSESSRVHLAMDTRPDTWPGVRLFCKIKRHYIELPLFLIISIIIN